ncbi:MAG: biopolymer transporter ExbD [Phycisphaerales bacterium]
MNFRRRPDSGTGITKLPLAALIDVVFFLLFYFIMAGTLTAEEGELPMTLSTGKRAAGSGSDYSTQVLFVQIEGGKPRYRLGTRAIESQEELTTVLAQLPKEPGIVVRADDEAPVQWTAVALQSARDAGFSRVSYVAGK